MQVLPMPRYGKPCCTPTRVCGGKAHGMPGHIASICESLGLAGLSIMAASLDAANAHESRTHGGRHTVDMQKQNETALDHG